SLESRRAEALGEQLSEWVRSASDQISAASRSLAEAVTQVEAGGTELGATAEMFAAAVEAHRDAARAWLEDLGEVDLAVARAGEGAAVEVLGQYLARTHEVFDCQLRFQQELLEQVR